MAPELDMEKKAAEIQRKTRKDKSNQSWPPGASRAIAANYGRHGMQDVLVSERPTGTLSMTRGQEERRGVLAEPLISFMENAEAVEWPVESDSLHMDASPCPLKNARKQTNKIRAVEIYRQTLLKQNSRRHLCAFPINQHFNGYGLSLLMLLCT
ncbi:hypothetical protein T4B_2568 [Trichinella pseudospiralis]|uniref:Uncharacterized protein n=1 Tax=Trichinella pseudospiralis TaxID=6337 RepID=A0A0V1JHX6_TRIPS|nr:hypothetical protein T4E_8745 [Trichinella pseudospiralis]KRZ34603.1 hypothetical protein T4B_2568 [Trichinella pseudospiralis]KRZ45254.1 hypothetical protein T4C_2023 [Trichinella pseudospiralis]